jgi:hypothetical protein
VWRLHPGQCTRHMSSELKRSSIDAHNMRKACNRPWSGDIFMFMKRVKIALTGAIKAHRMWEDSYFSNDLQVLLLDIGLVAVRRGKLN